MTSSDLPPSDCLSDAEVLAFAEGRVEERRLETLEAHLDECETCQHLVYEAAHALGTAATSPHLEHSDGGWNRTFHHGTLVAKRYLIQRFVARGGMGEVYEAFDRDLNERVALKAVSSTACDNPVAIRRLKAEVQLARRVSHPNVCRIYDLGTHALEAGRGAIHFLTMEFVEGETLGQRIRLGGPLAIDEALTLARDLLRGLSAAHAAEILHRDFKSDNVMLRLDSCGQSAAVILDFGLARAFNEDARGLTSESHPHLLGTVDYMAPEQLEGHGYSRLGDIYSFGVVLFEMLTGALPFEGPNRAAIALERLRRDPAQPSQLNPAVPPALDALVLRCLRRQPAERFTTADEVLASLERLSLAPSLVRSTGRQTLWTVGIASAVAVAVALGVRAALPLLPSAVDPPALISRAVQAATPAVRDGQSSGLSQAFLPPDPFGVIVGVPGVLSSVEHRTDPVPRRNGGPRANARPSATPPSLAPSAERVASHEPLPSASVSTDAPRAAASTPVVSRRKPDWENPFKK